MAAAPSPLRAIWRLLTFRLSADEFEALGRSHLVVALIWTWLVGMGRWWDDPGTHLAQHLGLGSLIYVFVLSALIWLVVLPLRPRLWSYARTLTFVAMTSPPAILYAIPVERIYALDTASFLNLWFLAAVAAWRVALLVRFLVTVPRVGALKGIVAAFLPLVAIVSTLFALNLHRVVFELMGSIEETERTGPCWCSRCSRLPTPLRSGTRGGVVRLRHRARASERLPAPSPYTRS
jgi:hypothetical protein